jgi:hypothetical protein
LKQITIEPIEVLLRIISEAHLENHARSRHPGGELLAAPLCAAKALA